MTGPQHYREAEADLAAARRFDEGSDIERYHLGAAQVHATLALAAAAALGGSAKMAALDYQAWAAAASAES